MASRVVLIENLMNCSGSGVRCGTASCDCSAAPQSAQGSPTWTLKNGLDTKQQSGVLRLPHAPRRQLAGALARVPGGVFTSFALGQLRLPPEI